MSEDQQLIKGATSSSVSGKQGDEGTAEHINLLVYSLYATSRRDDLCVKVLVCIFSVCIWIGLRLKCIQNNCAQVKKTTPLRELMEAYCSHVGVQTADFRFSFGSHRIRPEDTPESVSDTKEICFSFSLSQH